MTTIQLGGDRVISRCLSLPVPSQTLKYVPPLTLMI
jgi:hypothetical protein